MQMRSVGAPSSTKISTWRAPTIVGAACLRFGQLSDGVGSRPLPVEEPGVVVVVLAHGDEHVLMAEREAEGGIIDRAEDGLDGGHGLYSSCAGGDVRRTRCEVRVPRWEEGRGC